MRWLNSVGGTCRTGIGLNDDIGMVPVTKLVSSSGAYVIHGGSDQAEVLSGEIIEYFDRRLMVMSPFKSVERA